MSLRELGYGAYFLRSSNAVVAGTTEIDGASVDMLGASGGPFESAIAIVCMGTLTSTQVTTLKWQGSTDNSTFTDLAGTHQGPANDTDSNKMLISEIYRPTGYRYVRPVVTRGTANAVIDSIVVIAHNPHSYPVPSQDSTVSTPTSSGMGSTAVPVNVARYVVAGTA